MPFEGHIKQYLKTDVFIVTAALLMACTGYMLEIFVKCPAVIQSTAPTIKITPPNKMSLMQRLRTTGLE